MRTVLSLEKTTKKGEKEIPNGQTSLGPGQKKRGEKSKADKDKGFAVDGAEQNPKSRKNKESVVA